MYLLQLFRWFYMNAENRINLDLPMDSDRVQAEAQFATDFNILQCLQSFIC